MENGEIVIMSGGCTGNPFFTTDTGSSLRGIEIEADVMLEKGTRVDGMLRGRPRRKTLQLQNSVTSHTMKY